MWSRILFVAVFASVGAACTHTRQLHTQSSVTEFANATKPLRHRTLEARDQLGAWYRLEDARLTGDSIAGRLAGTETAFALPMESLISLSYESHSRGLIDGILLGATLGAVLGWVAYDGTCDVVVCAAQDSAVFGALAGTVWGLILGPLVGSTMMYEVIR